MKPWVVDMLERSDTSVSEVLKQFNQYELEVSFLVPTRTGMTKSIMDATLSVRDFLRDLGFHDYGRQLQGEDNKVLRRAYYIYPDHLEETTVSLYRPDTKNGDPRIWFGKLKGYADPYNLLALLIHDNDIYLINCSYPRILQSLNNPGSPLGSIAAQIRRRTDPVVVELLDKIRAISRLGFIPTVRPGDTGIGMTLERQLGIHANTSKTPDYKGIEIKAMRHGRKGRTRSTLFSQVPDWRISPVGSAWNLLSTYGYHREGRLQLYHQIDARAPNSIGFQLEVDVERDWLKQIHVDSSKHTKAHLVTWEMEELKKRLIEKHRQTFWVSAHCKGRGDGECFHYFQVRHTHSPSIRNFSSLLESGIISVDYTLSERKAGGTAVRDHGYLFRIDPRNLGALFPPPDIYVLA